jgi:hypothetical protein
VRTKNNEKLKFKWIELRDGQYFGVKKIKGIPIRTHLDSAKINYIRIKDKTLSTISTSVLSIVGAIGVLTLGVWIGDGAN